MKPLDTTLYFITDSTTVPQEHFLPIVEAACKGGATIVQLREKDKSTREYMDLAKDVQIKLYQHQLMENIIYMIILLYVMIH